MLRLRGAIFSALLTAAMAAGAAAQASADDLVSIDVVRPAAEVAAPAKPRLDDVFQSMSNTARTETAPRPTPILLAGVALVLMAVAVSQWKQRRAAKPKPVGDHRKLLDEIAKASGMSRRQLKRLESAARAGGLSSPLVAAVCPSVLLKRAGAARSGTERSMWVNLSRQVARRR